jgi:hypothetical protein
VNIDQDRINDLVAHPSESLNVEIKRWINPDDCEGIAKIVKAALAIRNRNGGFFLIGFDDQSLMPDTGTRPPDVRTVFHLDKVQALVSKYASEIFEIGVGFGNRDGLEYPVIVIPEGVVAPVAAKRGLMDDAGHCLIREGEFYFRTLRSNGTPSTARAQPSDWQDIIEICFENKEADIGRFLRRHLAGSNAGLITALTGLHGSPVPSPPTQRDDTEALLNDGEKRLQAAIVARELNPEEAAATKGGTWSVALVVDPPNTAAITDTNFLNTVAAANPQYTGWPVWLDSRGFTDQTSRPKVINKAWQALIISFRSLKHVDFMRMEPKGKFYLWRVLQDDLTDRVDPGTALDVILVLIRVAEAMAVGLSLAKALGWNGEARLGFGFRWTGLSGRALNSWANPLVLVSGGYVAHDTTADTFVEIPLDTPLSALTPYVEQATKELFLLFDGYTLPSEVVEGWVRRLLERRL